jgi:hypothetical protein
VSGRAEVRQLQTLAEATVDGRQRLSRFGDAAASLEQSCQAHRGAQLPPSRALALGDLEGATEAPLGIVGRLVPALAVATVPAAHGEPDLAAQALQLGVPPALFGLGGDDADKRVVTDLGATRYDLAAPGFGCHAEHVERPEDLVPALRRALAAGRPACVNVMTDPAVVSPVTVAMVGAAAPATGQSGEGERVVMPYYKPLGEG